MKGRGEIITILCMSVFLICILYAMTYGGIVKAEELEKQPEEAGEKTEVDIEEELRWAEEVKKILKDIGVGFCDETEDKQEEDKEETFDQTDEKKIQSMTGTERRYTVSRQQRNCRIKCRLTLTTLE